MRRLCDSAYIRRVLKKSLQLSGGTVMPRYMVERTFPDGLNIPINDQGEAMFRQVILNNAEDNVTWIHSYVSEDRVKTYCTYDAPSPEAIRRTARRNNLPIDRITEVRVLDP